jgi:hypothetical protein
MTSHRQRNDLHAQQRFLRERLLSIPATAQLTRNSIADRLEALDEELALLPEHARPLARARLTFDGRPVIGTQGVFADFGAKAMGRFSDAIATVAASLTAPLAAMGPIPGREQNQVLITNVALGSFGFELEEHNQGQILLDDKSPVALALERTQRLLEGSAVADDEALADAAADLDPRALDKVRSFVETLADNDAVCGLYVGDHAFRFTDPGQVRRSLERLSADNLHEHEEVCEVVLEGVLPTRRTFEFRMGNEVLAGKIGPAIADPHRINQLLDRPLRVQLLVTQVGAGRPRYTLIDAPEAASERPAGPTTLATE